MMDTSLRTPTPLTLTPLLLVVAIARELDLMPTWHKFVTQAQLVEKIHADKKDRTFGASNPNQNPKYN